MARIIITGEKEPLIVSDEEGEIISAQLNNPMMRGRITIPLANGGSRSVSQHNIRDVQIGSDPGMGGAMINIDTPQGRRQAEELRSTLDAYQATATMEHELEWYGAPLEGHSETAQAKLRASGIVGNEVLGAAHWSTVQWALEKKLISRRVDTYTLWTAPKDHTAKPVERVRWSVLGVAKGDQIDPGEFNRFDRVWKGVKELRSRKLWALKAAQEEEEALLASRIEPEPEMAAQGIVEPNQEVVIPHIDLG